MWSKKGKGCFWIILAIGAGWLLKVSVFEILIIRFQHISNVAVCPLIITQVALTDTSLCVPAADKLNSPTECNSFVGFLKIEFIILTYL